MSAERDSAPALFVTIKAECMFVSAGLGYVCCNCRALVVGEPRIGFVLCDRCRNQGGVR